MNFGLDPFMMLILISVISVAVRYFFASGTAYISAMLPVFLIVGMNAGIDPTLLAFIMIGTNCVWWFRNSLRCGSWSNHLLRWLQQCKDWWTVGLISAVVCLVLNYVIGIPLVENHWFHVI